jgi:hypothetical protein
LNARNLFTLLENARTWKKNTHFACSNIISTVLGSYGYSESSIDVMWEMPISIKKNQREWNREDDFCEKHGKVWAFYSKKLGL